MAYCSGKSAKTKLLGEKDLPYLVCCSVEANDIEEALAHVLLGQLLGQIVGLEKSDIDAVKVL